MDEPNTGGHFSRTKSPKSNQVYYFCRFESIYGGQGTGTGFGISTNKYVLYKSVLRDLIEVLEPGYGYYIYFLGEIKLDEERSLLKDYGNFQSSKEILVYDEDFKIDEEKSKQNLKDVFKKYLKLELTLNADVPSVTDSKFGGVSLFLPPLKGLIADLQSKFQIKSLDNKVVITMLEPFLRERKISEIDEDYINYLEEQEYDFLYVLKDGEAKMFF